MATASTISSSELHIDTSDAPPAAQRFVDAVDREEAPAKRGFWSRLINA